jgi:cyanate lyase
MFSRVASRIKLASSTRTIGLQTDITGRRLQHDYAKRAERVERLLSAKTAAGLSYDELAKQLGVTNTYAAQLMLGQAKLTPGTAEKLKQVLPSVADADIAAMRDTFPMRSYDDEILKDPHVYRTFEAVTHYGVAIKSIINEQCGDGIMSAIDFYCDVGVSKLWHVACGYI